MLPQVVNIDRSLFTADKLLQFLRVEHPQPFGIDQIGQPVKECARLESDLTVEFVFADKLDI